MASVVEVGYVARSKVATPPSSTSSPHSAAGSSHKATSSKASCSPATTMTPTTPHATTSSSSSGTARQSMVSPASMSVPAAAGFMPKPVTPPSPGQTHNGQHIQDFHDLQTLQDIPDHQNQLQDHHGHDHGREPHPDSLHTHRQNHNSSKLPAFRFADLKKKDAFSRSSRLPHHQPPTPVSPPKVADAVAAEANRSVASSRAPIASPDAVQQQPRQVQMQAPVQAQTHSQTQLGTPFQNTPSTTCAPTPGTTTTPGAAGAFGAAGATALATYPTAEPTEPTSGNSSPGHHPSKSKRRNSAGRDLNAASRGNGATNGTTQTIQAQNGTPNGAAHQNTTGIPFSPSRPSPARSRASTFQTLQTIPSISSLPSSSPSSPPSSATQHHNHALSSLPAPLPPHPQNPPNPHTSLSSSSSTTTAVTASSAATNTSSTSHSTTPSTNSANSGATNTSSHSYYSSSNTNTSPLASAPLDCTTSPPAVYFANTPNTASVSRSQITPNTGDSGNTGITTNTADTADTADSGETAATVIPAAASESATVASAKLQRTLTDPSPSRVSSAAQAAAATHRRAPASFSSNGLETAHGPPSAFAAKRLQAFNVQAAAAAAAQNDHTEGQVAATAPPSVVSGVSAQSAQSGLSGQSAVSSGQSSFSGLTGPPAAVEANTKEWTKGQRELILPKAVQDDKLQLQNATQSPADDRRKQQASRPPISFRPPRSDGSSTTRAVIPPIRSFRSSGSRKSLVLDMSLRSPGAFSDAESVEGAPLDPNQRDRTLRALEGRTEEENYYQQLLLQQQQQQRQVASQTRSAVQGPSESENTADLFMRIAHEDSKNRSSESDEPSTVSRVTRTSSQRRPYSAAVPSHRPASPPQVVRRLSDQRETSRHRRPDEHSSLQPSGMPLRTFIKDSRPPVRSASIRTRSGAPSRTSPTSTVFYDAVSDVGVNNYSRRRSSITDSASAILPSRTSSTKASHSHVKAFNGFNSSPLAPRTVDIQRHDQHDVGHSVLEGTESSASTAAPSTVWDELDELKSRMRRLESTGKSPATPGTAMSRISDDRPATAMTTATTVSNSPRRGSNYAQTEILSSSSSQLQKKQLLSFQRDTHLPSHSTLVTALQKARPHTSNDVYSAIETMASEALSLSQMVGVSGKAGPISSGASAIGTGGPATATDRQLRRKAENICRSLTELCLALNEEASSPTQNRPTSSAAAAVASAAAAVQAASSPREEPAATNGPTSPTVSKAFSSLAVARRAAKEPLSIKTNTEPRTLTRLDERRTSFLTTPTLAASPRLTFAPASASAATENTGRRSSLLLSRTRRATSEEVEEQPQTGRRSSLLRFRRAGTEEPDEGRKSSLLLRTRKTIVVDEEDDLRRPPSRAATEVAASPRTPRRDYQHLRDYQTPLSGGSSAASAVGTNEGSSPLLTSALPRRRFVSSNLTTSRTTPQSATSATTPSLLSGRRFLERTTPDRDTASAVGSYSEERVPRQMSLSQTAALNRTNGHRYNEEAAMINSATSQVGGYR